MYRIRNAYRQARSRDNWFTQARVTVTWGILLVLLSLIGAVYLKQASEIALIGRNTQLLEEELDRVRQRNAVIEQQIARAQSIDSLYRRAEELGMDFRSPSPIELDYIEIEVAPELPPLPPPAPETVIPPASIGEALWAALQQSVGRFIQGESNEG